MKDEGDSETSFGSENGLEWSNTDVDRNAKRWERENEMGFGFLLLGKQRGFMI